MVRWENMHGIPVQKWYLYGTMQVVGLYFRLWVPQNGVYESVEITQKSELQ
jgi:hypothetical protein